MSEEEQLPYHQQRAMRKSGLLPPLPTKKEKKPLKRKSDKKIAQEKEQREAGTDGLLDAWFVEMRKKMVGRCLFCNSVTQKKDDEKYRWNIAHLLPKRPVDKGGFPSVKTHNDNWIELCTFGNDCHGNFDRGQITWDFIKDSKEWEIIREKLLNVLPMVAPEEKKNKLYSKLENLVYDRNSTNS